MICCPTNALQKATLAEIDHVFADSPVAPLIRWRVVIDVDDEDEMPFADFRTFLVDGMPQLLERGKLIVEECFIIDNGFSDWAMKT